MAAQFKASPTGRSNRIGSNRIGSEPRPGHGKRETMQEQGTDEEAYGQPPPPLPSLCVPMHSNP